MGRVNFRCKELITEEPMYGKYDVDTGKKLKPKKVSSKVIETEIKIGKTSVYLTEEEVNNLKEILTNTKYMFSQLK